MSQNVWFGKGLLKKPVYARAGRPDGPAWAVTTPAARSPLAAPPPNGAPASTDRRTFGGRRWGESGPSPRRALAPIIRGSEGVRPRRIDAGAGVTHVRRRHRVLSDTLVGEVTRGGDDVKGEDVLGWVIGRALRWRQELEDALRTRKASLTFGEREAVTCCLEGTHGDEGTDRADVERSLVSGELSCLVRRGPGPVGTRASRASRASRGTGRHDPPPSAAGASQRPDRAGLESAAPRLELSHLLATRLAYSQR